ncbi:hypothetical protein Taro_048335 [Colocasia esculenta]|uniref:3-ketoacyl-CoA synthase n=1 Tax=Colocasia esculenta TaxID=4460 RepID=A0A843WXX0_COLES|nr:hypothetical protein [Colocasia esculenta]
MATASTVVLFAEYSLQAMQLDDVFLQHKLVLVAFLWCAVVAVFAYFSRWRRHPVLLLDYSCYKPDDEQKMSYEASEYFIRRSRRYNSTSEEFMRAIYLKSGLGDETYAPPFLFGRGDATHASGVQEAEAGMYTAVDALLSKTRVDASQIDVLVAACSMFTPCPSLTSLLVRRYGCRPSVKTFNLSGMGCSAGAIAVDMAAGVLRRKPGYALVVTMESTSVNWYYGDDRSMLVTNCIFRVGTAAMLLTSDPARRAGSKLELVRSLRTHHGADDASHGAAVQREDEAGAVGVALSKDLVRVAGAGLREHIRALAPSVLPLSELLRYAGAVAASAVAQRIPGGGAAKGDGGHAAAAAGGNVPDFTKAFEHMCFHPGGKAVINALGRLLRLPEWVVEPARMTLHRFGNTSSSSVVYELGYLEAKGRIRRGDRVWMLAFGTGFKACSLVWRATRDSTLDCDNPWVDSIYAYPVPTATARPHPSSTASGAIARRHHSTS